MRIIPENSASMSEANQNFSKVAKMVDTKGPVVIFHHNSPRYVIIEYKDLTALENTHDDTIEEIANKILHKHREAFKALAR